MTVTRNLRELGAATFLTPAKADHLKNLFDQCGQSTHELCKEAHQYHVKFCKNGKYDQNFRDWYRENGLNERFGEESNFSKFAHAGKVLVWLEKQDGFDIARLPAARDPLYKISQLNEKDRRPLLAEKNDATGSLVINPNMTGEQIERYRKQLKQSRQGSNGKNELPRESVVVAKITVEKKALVTGATEQPGELNELIVALNTTVEAFSFASVELVGRMKKRRKKSSKATPSPQGGIAPSFPIGNEHGI